MKYLASLLFFLILTSSLKAQMLDSQQRIDQFNVSDSKVALDGYDPVSYFKSDKPKKGSSDISYTYEGVNYYFTSEENLASFKEKPGKYEPAYGG